MKKGKRSITRIFLRGFVLSFFIVIIMLGAGVLGYQATIKLWMPEQSEPAAIVTAEAGNRSDTFTVISSDQVTKRLIFSYDKKKHTIDKLLLQIFHSEKKQLTYITIPMSSRYTMSDTLYRKLILVQPSIPQIIRLSSISNYFDQDAVFDYGTQIISDLLGIEISYYSVLPVKLYQSVFTEEAAFAEQADLQVAAQADLQTASRTMEVFSENFLASMKDISSTEELRSYIEDLYTKIETNEPLENLLSYLDSFYATPLEKVAFEHLAGEEQNSGFIMDRDAARQRFYELDAYE